MGCNSGEPQLSSCYSVRTGFVDWAIILGELCNFAHILLKSISFLACKYRLGPDVLNHTPCEPCMVSAEIWPNFQTVCRFGLRGHWAPENRRDSFTPLQAISNMKTSRLVSTKNLRNTFWLCKYCHFPNELLVGEKQVPSGLILYFSYFL